eukprot:CAMPEP_0201631600 /NCGR_PEP_ID=MMETSP0493-20130528/5526_1 /ASSEMBLY_ACC=CAM_ASM_000838 /TAXON_ID=420259 /ORGANISM="Thalassiosira gravida, Strain GMp14c1" /LENGTH=61 /DNA_ID=CAMNT_0048102963 /DNA_START=249 /DNA_END=434 /DNA_ORIENTATION=-
MPRADAILMIGQELNNAACTGLACNVQWKRSLDINDLHGGRISLHVQFDSSEGGIVVQCVV